MVELFCQEFGTITLPNGKTGQGVTHQYFRQARVSELEYRPPRATRGGAIQRKVQGLAAVPCLCGCGEETSGRDFRPGHDAKLKAALRYIAQERDGKGDCYKFWFSRIDKDEAQRRLTERGW